MEAASVQTPWNKITSVPCAIMDILVGGAAFVVVNPLLNGLRNTNLLGTTDLVVSNNIMKAVLIGSVLAARLVVAAAEHLYNPNMVIPKVWTCVISYGLIGVMLNQYAKLGVQESLIYLALIFVMSLALWKVKALIGM